jgi:adenosylmethionine-8-amino-7-oxononanoate aminotransferase
MEEPYSISLYPGTGTVDGRSGDHVIISPAYTVTSEEVEMIVDRAVAVIEDFFKDAEVASANGVH